MKNHALYDTPYGTMAVIYEDNVIRALLMPLADTLDYKVGRLPGANKVTELTEQVNREIQEYFRGERKEFTFPIEAEGTEFQRKVWKALRDIPYGETRSYKDIAVAIDNPKACRAVGMANNKNPHIIVVPCHRVIGANGTLVGYANGLEMKEKLLEMEKNNK